MASVDVFKGRTLLFSHTLERDRTVIGRNEFADIALDSQAVSRHHAVIKRQGVAYIIEDQGTQNGMFVNGNYTPFKVLDDGDEIEIAQHLLIFRQSKADVARARSGQHIVAADRAKSSMEAMLQSSPGTSRGAVDSSVKTAYMAPDVQQQLREELEKRRKPHLAWVIEGERHIIPLERHVVLIGWEQDCDVRLPGARWFAKTAARLRRHPDGSYTIEPMSWWRRVTVNGTRAQGPVPLNDEARIDLLGLSLRFHVDLRSLNKATY